MAQRALDIQDGRVLWVLGFAHEAFRSARAFDGTILLPDLGKLTRLYEAGAAERPRRPRPTPRSRSRGVRAGVEPAPRAP